MKFTNLCIILLMLLCACTDNIQLSEPSFFDESENSTLSSEKSIAVIANSDFGAQYYDSIMSTEKWAACESLDERQELLNLDDTTLHELTTSQLVLLCMNYPLRFIYTAYNDPIMGIETIKEGFNVFNELSQRPDCENAIFETYQTLADPVIFKLSSDTQAQADRKLDCEYLELLIASGTFPSLTQGSKKSTIDEFISRSISSDYIKNSIYKNTDLCHNYQLRSSSNINVWTLFGSEIEALSFPEMSVSEIESINSYYKTMFSGAEYLGSATSYYNCHSYAWNMRADNGPICWINYYKDSGVPNIPLYWTRDSYSESQNFDDCKIVLYNGADHSAYNTQDGMVVSKWGRGPLMKHKIKDCPYKTYNLRYFKRIPLSGVLETSYGIGTTLVNRTDSYFISSKYIPQDRIDRLSLSIQIDTTKGDDAVELGRAEVVEQTTSGFKVKFTTAGLYNIIIFGTNSRGEKIVQYSFEPIVEM